ncbi:MAG: glycine--tRNA ligase subunit beta [Syntrophobacterales bacterium]|nr:MAG: glycine--tRNA ligase subunit beta [Syntrophobacterales bacterium]
MGKELLLEIGTEEIPAGFISKALEEMSLLIQGELHANRIAHGEVRTLGTPRRLVLLIEDVAEKQEDVEREKLGPPLQMAFDEKGKPTKAAMGFAKGQGLGMEDLKTVKREKGEYLCAVKKEEGKPSSLLFREILPRVIGAISFPKSMRWGTVKIRFARPIHWILALFNGQVIPFGFGGIESGNRSYGHRFMSPHALEVRDFQTYEKQIKGAFVIVDPQERRKMIEEGIAKAAKEVSGRVLGNEDLLEEVIHLVEYPTAIVGTFEKEFLNLPREVVINAMEEHQRYFPVVDENENLMPYFVCVCNTRTPDMETVKRGNERVLKARLSDAKFFFYEDTKEALDRKVEALKGVIFQAQLGTSYEKVLRFKELALYLAREFRPDLKEKVERAAMLCKADLVTGMVGEFPTLQGVVGREYALISGEDEEVAIAIFEHYLPAFAGDRLPSGTIADFISIGDKLDTIVGCFGIGLIPTGAGDPFALRRQALGIIHVILGKGYPISLTALIRVAMELLKEKIERSPEEIEADVLAFFRGRFANLLASRGYPGDLVESVLAVQADDLRDAHARVEVLAKLREKPQFEPLAVVFKRIANILKGADYRSKTNPGLFEEPQEKELHQRYLEMKGDFDSLMKNGDYKGVMAALAKLHVPVNKLFDHVLVMAEDKKVRDNRLALLGEIHGLFSQVADFSRVRVADLG